MTDYLPAAIDAARVRIAERLDAAGVAKLTADLANTPAEHFRYQQLQAQAHAVGAISTGDAMIIYRALGEVPAADGWSSRADLATRVVVTQVMGELMRARKAAV